MAKYKLAFNSQDQKRNAPKGFDDFDLKLGDTLRGERATLGKSVVEVQNELKIKASYISAIENCDLDAFPNKGFVAGYVRSYARYLNLNPEEVYERFCTESGFSSLDSSRKFESTDKFKNKGLKSFHEIVMFLFFLHPVH